LKTHNSFRDHNSLKKIVVKKTVSLMCMAVLVVAGCHKKVAAPPSDQISATPEAPAATPEQAPSGAQSAPTPVVQPAKALPPPPPSVAARAENNLRQNVPGEPDPFLSGELRNFVQLKKRLPDSFSEFASVRLDSIPRPPEGKKWVIDIANLQVKSVPAK
jgi:hypothetical protein